ncbi:hypothetical protein CARUB_v10024516mg [Capsella rubella]|uniref:Uncharacterized protein n=1 Tax=Capsella rubella TaxID=81985 RepID=R0HSG6_9BRAS|nr:hypothetical protein CARUB_v10024516mg [Capsella rubella]
MKSSEGRRHQGVVRTGMIHQCGFNLRPTNRRLDSPPASKGVFTKVPSKTVGESERSKYSNCHVSPAIKSGHKSKGRSKIQPTSLWSEDMLDRLVGSDSSSATDILDTLCKWRS